MLSPKDLTASYTEDTPGPGDSNPSSLHVEQARGRARGGMCTGKAVLNREVRLAATLPSANRRQEPLPSGHIRHHFITRLQDYFGAGETAQVKSASCSSKVLSSIPTE